MTSPRAAIRTAATADVPEIQRLNAALFAFEDQLGLYDHSRNLDWSYTDHAADYFRKCAAQEGNYAAFVAEIEGVIIGYLAASIYERLWMAVNPIAEIDNMFVEPLFRGQGAGSSLVDAFKAWAQTKNARRLKVGALTGNHPAMAFYRRNGFTDIETYLEQAI